MCMYVKILGQNYFKARGGGGECKTLENFKFYIFKKKRGKMVIYWNSPEKS